MPNNPSVIARPTTSGFAGRYVWNDGHPSMRLPLLLHLHAGPFGRDVEKMCAFLIDEHPAGWSQLGDDPTADTGWVGLTGSRVGETRFVCHCHGDRSDPEWQITEQTGDPDEDGWIYVLRPEGVEVWHPTPSGDAWRHEPVVPWLDVEPTAGCSAGLLPVGDGPFEPCVIGGAHEEHATAEGRRWRSFDLDESDEPTGELYPSQIGVFCDGCGTTVEHDYVVSDDMDQAQRFEVARTHLRTNEGWHCAEGVDLCPRCKPVAVEARPARPDGEA